MSNILHILNGDATLNGFRETRLEGDVLVWREILSEGPLLKNVASADFWQQRSEWICSFFKETPQNYHNNMIVQLEKLHEPFQEINLWFEYDLNCQVNLLGAMMLISQQTNLSAPGVYLICPNEFPGVEDFRGLGELNGEQQEYLFDNIRVQLGEFDFTLATEAWGIYISGDAILLEKWLLQTTFWGNMHLLKAAMAAHLKRLQINEKGLNYIQQTLLDIYINGAHTNNEIYHAFLKTEKIYGMGDMEINLYLRQLVASGFMPDAAKI
ncbi:DUF1835 domain-containing protein [Mucilaginibacter segetis]|uniref:DUF1835 domain-containing protein n=1 Tax=Mucilaginibacter segetis TaxID=2793071 RepID=A0A934PWE7_9SPHI|nr:DUF1835 domain-containing protein [Mucilaginibacter segetis]MBK0380248.1 DUF1835 domain-containing protein [Mucilaginibacter segetis]